MFCSLKLLVLIGFHGLDGVDCGGCGGETLQSGATLGAQHDLRTSSNLTTVHESFN